MRRGSGCLRSSSGGGGLLKDASKRAVAFAASLAMVASMVPVIPVATAMADPTQETQGSVEEGGDGGGLAPVSEDSVRQNGATLITSDTHEITASGAYYIAGDTEIYPDSTTGNGIKIADGISVLIYIPQGATLTVSGANATSKTHETDEEHENTVGKAAIYLPESSKLTVAGQGTIKAQGGNAGNGVSSLNGGDGAQTSDHEEFQGGNGANGGHGGGGAGAGIGTDGGAGGQGGQGGYGVHVTGTGDDADKAGENGADGEAGEQAAKAGSVVFAGSVNVDVQGGAAGTGGAGGKGGKYVEESTGWGTRVYSTAGGAGGGGGAGGEFAYGIGSGGAGGSGGGGGGGGGHYYDGTGGAAFTYYFWCGSEGGAAGNGVTCGDKKTSGSAGEKSQVSDNAHKTGDNLDMRCTSKPGGSAAASTSVSQGTAYSYQSMYAADSFVPKYAKDNNLGETRVPLTVRGASSLKSAGFYTVDINIDGNGGTFGEDASKTITVVPGAEPLKSVYDQLTGDSNVPERTGYNLTGFALHASDADSAFLSNTDKKWGWTGDDASANPLYAGNYVSGAMATDDSTLQSVLWTGFAGPVEVVAQWEGIAYTITYNRNATWLTKHSVSAAPKWISTSTEAASQELDSDTYTETGFRYTDSSKDEDKDQLAISASMNSSDGYSWPTKPAQTYYLHSASDYRHLGWTTSVNDQGIATGDFYPCGSKINGLTTKGGDVTLYAVWGDKDDIYSPAFTATDTTVPYNYSAADAKVTIKANPYWGQNTEKKWGSYFVNVLYGGKTYTLTTRWQQRTDNDWQDIDTGINNGYSNNLDDSAFTDSTRFSYQSDAYYKGDYCNNKLVSTLSLPTGFVAGTNNEYRVVYTITSNSSPTKTFTYTSGSVRFKVTKANFTGFTVSDTDGNDLTGKEGYSVDYDGKTHGIQVGGMESYHNVLGANLVYYSATDSSKVSGKAPSEPGEYYAAVKFHCSDTANYNVPADLVKKITVNKKQLAIPTPKDNLMVSIDLATGEAKEQSAFDEEYTSNELYTAEGYKQTDAGSYDAIFTLKDGVADHYVWKGGSTAPVTVRYYIDSMIVAFGQDEVFVNSKSYDTAWEGTSNKDDGKVKSAKLKSTLFGTDGELGDIPNWVLNWNDEGKPYCKDSSFYYYICGDVESKDLSQLKIIVGYDKDGNEITFQQLAVWIEGDTVKSGDAVYVDGKTIIAKSFDDIAEYGVKDTSVSVVGLSAYNDSRNVFVYGSPMTKFSISKADPSPSPSPSPAPDPTPEPTPSVTKITVPSAYAGLVANGTEQAGIDEGKGYVLSGDYKATKAGTYTATVKLADGYVWADGTSDAKQIEWTIAKAAKQLVYNGKEQTGIASDAGYEMDGDYKATDAGTYKAYIALKDGYVWADGTKVDHKVVKWSIAKADNPVVVKNKVKTVKYAKVKAKSVKVKPVTVKGAAAGTTPAFKKIKKGSAAKAYKALTVNKKTGKVTVKKGTKKGTYKLRYKVSVTGNANYNSFVKTVTVKVKVK